jgi:ATP-dependent helicase/nuclease subunit A
LALGDAETARLAQAIAGFLEGSYARTIRDEEAELGSDEPFVLRLDGGPRPGLRSAEPSSAPGPGGRAGRTLVLSGTCDLRVDRGGARVDVIAVSTGRARAELGALELELRGAALAAAQASPEAKVWAGVLFLGGGAELCWLRGRGSDGALDVGDHARFAAEVGALAHPLAEARYHDRFEGIERAGCQRLSCRFLAACHGAQGDGARG